MSYKWKSEEKVKEGEVVPFTNELKAEDMMWRPITGNMVSITVGDETRTAQIFKKKNGCFVYWDPFTGKRIFMDRSGVKIPCPPVPKDRGNGSMGRKWEKMKAKERGVPWKKAAWVGDKILAIAAFELLESIRYSANIYQEAQNLVTNDNMRGGDAIETEVGTLYHEEGFAIAHEVATEFLKTTRRWAELTATASPAQRLTHEA